MLSTILWVSYSMLSSIIQLLIKTNQMKFKKGDLVRCIIKNSTRFTPAKYLKKGEVYPVVFTNFNDTIGIFVRGRIINYMNKRFELVKSTSNTLYEIY